MGAYLCIAQNGVPPSISKRIILTVECEYIYYWIFFSPVLSVRISNLLVVSSSTDVIVSSTNPGNYTKKTKEGHTREKRRRQPFSVLF